MSDDHERVTAALERLRLAIQTLKGDTLASVGLEEQIAFLGSGSWSPDVPVTFGDLILIMNALTEALPAARARD